MYTPFLGPALALLSALSFAFGNNFMGLTQITTSSDA